MTRGSRGGDTSGPLCPGAKRSRHTPRVTRIIRRPAAHLAGDALAGNNEVLAGRTEYTWERVAAELPEDTLDALHAQAEEGLGEMVTNLNNYYYLHIAPSEEIWAIAAPLEELPGVARAMPVPLPMDLPSVPDYESNQGYLEGSSAWPPTGVSAEYAWTKAWGDGTSVRICDLEYGWNLNHVDLSGAGITSLNTFFPVTPGGTDDIDHGTAVLGELVAVRNGFGVTGIAKGAKVSTFATYYGVVPPAFGMPCWRVGEALVYAAAALGPGDVILLEQQWNISPPSSSYVPIECWGMTSATQKLNGVYAAIKNAVGKGIHVVEAAGNGAQNLDNFTWYGDSGAIVVGAGGVDKLNWNEPGDLERIKSSSYGARVNVQAWGESVWTTGYGTQHGSSGSNDAYTGNFAGTSSASAMVAAVVADCVGYWKMGLMQGAASLKPATLRSILISTGTAQVDTGIPPTPIGPRPDLKKAFAALETQAPAVVQWIDLSVPKATLHTGDTFYLRAAITNNTGVSLGTVPLLAAVDVAGNLLFYPTWTAIPQVGLVNVGTGTTTVDIFPSVTWPAGLGSFYGAKAYALLLSPGLAPIGRLGFCEFNWAP